MKKVLFVAIIATLIAVGCEKTTIINPQPEAGITFNTDMGKLTKDGTTADQTTLQAQGFKVSAINAYDDIYTTDNEFNDFYYGMNNLGFTYLGSSWNIKNGQSYFWPGTGKDLVFFAVSSKTQGVVIPTISYVPEVKEDGFGISGTKDQNTGAYSGIVVHNFTIPSFKVTSPEYAQEETTTTDGTKISVGTQTGADDDLMVAKVVIQNQGETPTDGVKGRVDLNFEHTLSKVQFVFTTSTTENYPVQVTEVKVLDVINEATLGVNATFADNARTSTNEYDWSPENDNNLLATKVVPSEGSNTSANYTNFVIDYPLNLVNGKELPYATWLVIPQSIEGKMVSISYTITDNTITDTNVDKVSEFTSVFPLYNDELISWARNQYVKYKVNLSPNLITFNPVVSEDWQSVIEVGYSN